MRGPGYFIAELRRRRVFRVAAWYAAVAWLLIQVAVNTFGPLGLPSWSVRAVIVLLLCGFPVALLLAWAFDIRPDAGAADEATPQIEARPTWRSTALWLALAAGVLLALGAQQAWHRVVEPALDTQPVIAVLPILAAPGTDADQAAGLHSLLIDELGANPNLVVLSKDSVSPFDARTVDLVRVQETLDADHALLGTLERRADRLRLELTLRSIPDGSVVWRGAFARPVGELLLMQRELADAVASALSIALPPTELRSAAKKVDLAAIDAYQRGRRAWEDGLVARGDERRRLMTAARDQLRAAVEADPNFPVAWALYADALLDLAPQLWDSENYEETIAPARAALTRADALDSNLFEVAVVQAYLAGEELDFARYVRESRRAVNLRPNSGYARNMLAKALWSIGDHAGAIAQLEERVRREPVTARAWYWLGINQSAVGDIGRARSSLDRAVALDGARDFRYLLARAAVDFHADGDLRRLDRFLAEHEVQHGSRFDWEFRHTLSLLARGDREGFARYRGSRPFGQPGAGGDWAGWMMLKLADPAEGQRYVRAALDALNSGEARDRRPGRQAYTLIGRGLMHAMLGEDRRASEILDQARALLDPAIRDSVHIHARYLLAMAYCTAQDLEQATEVFERALPDPADDWLTSPWAAWRYLPAYTRNDATRRAWEYEPLREVFRRHGVDVDKSIDDYPEE